MTDARKPNLVRSAREGLPSQSFSHPLNPKSEVHMQSLGDAVGLERIGIHVVRVPPGKESFVYHAHHTEEEFVYILSGRGMAEIDDEEVEVGPGDFMGFPTPSVGHHLKNPFNEDLVYISGGERHPTEIAEFPRQGRRFVRVGMTISLHPTDSAEGLGEFPRVDTLGKKSG
jgi:uncharacterized cupin superfamily protein